MKRKVKGTIWPYPLIREITLRNFLSFGPDTPPLKLEPLNVLIGPNGAGKSNLIEAIALMRSTPGDIRAVLRRGGGAPNYIWQKEPNARASIELVVTDISESNPIRHSISFFAREHADFFWLENEQIDPANPVKARNKLDFYYRANRGSPVLNKGQKPQNLDLDQFEGGKSILAQVRDPAVYPMLAFLGNAYEHIALYRDWVFGQKTVFRVPQKTDLLIDRLDEDYSNLALFLSHLRRDSQVKERIIKCLRDLYDGLTDFEVSLIAGGYAQINFFEEEIRIPGVRLSDGSLRYLALLAILCDPSPPPLICIEEPELGLHPDLMTKLADLLVEASGRTQLIVTTHSDILVDALSDRPESIVVCEKHDSQTTMERLDPEQMKVWLDKYRLGELWISGELGGTRW